MIKPLNGFSNPISANTPLKRGVNDRGPMNIESIPKQFLAALLTTAAMPCLPVAAKHRPAAPSDLTVTLQASRQISLRWIDHSTNELLFYLDRSTDRFSN